MKVHINQVSEIDVNSALVSFKSPLGHAVARWMGSPPIVGDEYDVEMDIPGVLRWDIEMSALPMPVKAAIYSDGSHVCIVAQLQGIGDDGVGIVQLGDDVIFVEVNGTPSTLPCGVLIRIPCLQLFDMRL